MRIITDGNQNKMIGAVFTCAACDCKFQIENESETQCLLYMRTRLYYYASNCPKCGTLATDYTGGIKS
jgi:primosomal protein N'